MKAAVWKLLSITSKSEAQRQKEIKLKKPIQRTSVNL